MASSENNNNANEHGAGPERDAVPTTVVESTEQVKEEANPEPATETGERPSVDKSGEGVVERAEETKLRPDVAERAESSGPVSTKQEPAPPDPRAEKSDIAPGTTAQPSTTEDSKPSPAHPVEVSSAESQPSGDDTNASSTQNPQPSVPGPNPSNVETQQSSEIENAPAEPSTHSAHEEPEDIGPSVTITLLLTSGARHPFKINGRYLRKRSIDVPDYDPFKMSVYTLKELILREWRTEWETRPSSPSAIRLIFFGKLLEDKSPISEYKFNQGAPNVVHMTVKPQEVMDEEDAKTSKSAHGRDRDANESSPGCRCVIL